jgi:hypothetical protein
MKLRIDKDLRFWIEAEMHMVLLIHDPEANEENLMRAALQEYAERGLATRYVNSKGRISWKATEKMHQHLEDQELTESVDW